MLSPAGIAAGSTVSVTRFLREHRTEEIIDSASGIDDKPQAWAPDSCRGCSRLRNEATQLKARLDVAEAFSRKCQSQLHTAQSELEDLATSKMQTSQLKSQIELSKCEATNEQTRREAAEAEARSLQVCVSSLELENAKILKAMAESEQHLLDMQAKNQALHAQLQQTSEVASAAIEDAAVRATALQAHMIEKTQKMKLVIEKTKSEGQHRLESAQLNHREILTKLFEERDSLAQELDQARVRCAELETRLEHQQKGMADALEKSSARSVQNIQASDAKARELQMQLTQQAEISGAEIEKATARIKELEMQLAHEQKMAKETLARLQEEAARSQEAIDLKNSTQHAQLTSKCNTLIAELEGAAAQKQELQAQLSRQQKETESAVERERAESEQMAYSKDAKNRDLQKQLLNKSALNEKTLLRVSELEFQLAEKKQQVEDSIARSTRELEQSSRDAAVRTAELESQLKQQREATANALEQAMLRASELDAQAASHSRTLLATEQRAHSCEQENSTLHAEIAQQRRATAAANEAEAVQAFKLRENSASESRAMQDALAKEKAAGGQRLQESEEAVLRLRAELAEKMSSAAKAEEEFARAEHGIAKQAAELNKCESEVASQQHAIREGQHELDAHESTSCLMRERADQECAAFRAARESELAAEARMSQLEFELQDQCNAMKAAVSWAKANTKQRVRSLQAQRDQHREAESQLAQQENELRDLLELVKAQSEQDVQVCEARNIDLQAELTAQRHELDVCQSKVDELEDLLRKQKEATSVEARAMESVSELATELAQQRDELKESCEARIKKLKQRIRDLEMMLEISKECLKGDHNKGLNTEGEMSYMGIRHMSHRIPDDAWSSTSGHGRVMPKGRLHSSRSAGSLHSVSRDAKAYVVKDVGFSWPGRHLGPDEEGAVKMTCEDLEDGN